MTDRTQINAKISARILAFVVNGNMSLREAFNTVLGASAYECLVEELYVELRAKGGL